MKRFGALVGALLLTACGGGGGGGNGGLTGPGMSLSSANISFQATRGQPGPQQTIEINVSGTVTDVAYFLPQGSPGWLAISGQWTSSTTLKVFFTITNTNLTAGVYTTFVRFLGRDSNLVTQMTSDAQITLTVVEPVPPVSFGQTRVTAAAVYGHSATTHNVSVSVVAPGKNWQVSSSAPWISLPSGSQQGSTTLNITADSSALALGQHEATIQLVNADDPTETDDLVVALSVALPEVAFSGAAPLVLGGVDGLDESPREIAFSLGTGSNQYPWSLTIRYSPPGSGWLVLDKSSGTVGAAGEVLGAQATTDSLAPGVYEALLTYTIQVLERTVVVNQDVRLHLEENRIYVVENGVALRAMPSRDRLAASVQVLSSRDRLDIPWTAASDQAWLTVTADGLTGATLNLQADPAGLAADAVHTATVTIGSPDPAVDNQETITVALWKGSAEPADIVINAPLDYTATNPVFPYVHVAKGDSLHTYNVYTGALVSTLSLPYALAQDLAVSSDGKTIFVGDASGPQFAGLALATGAVTSNGTRFTPTPLTYLRVEGHPIVAPTLATQLLDDRFGASRDNRTLFRAENLSDGTFRYRGFQLDYSALPTAGLAFSSITVPQSVEAGTIEALAMPSDEQLLVALTGTNEFRLYAAAAKQQVWVVPALGLPNNTLARSDGLLICGSSVATETPDIQLLSLDGEALGTLTSPTGALLRDQMALTSDSARLVVPTDAGVIGVLEIPVPP